MTNLSVYPSPVIDALAEGDPHDHDLLEPFHPLKTSIMPVIVAQQPSNAETGVLPSLEISQESRESTEGQDASRTADEPAPSTAAYPVIASAPDKVPTILIVEDATELAEVIQATLERINMVTFHETHGERALTLLHDKNPDVVLLDINLPDMTGWKILDSIKEKHDQTQTQMPIVIVISAYGDPANRLIGKLMGIHSYLIKPFTADEVERSVTEALLGAAL